MIKLINRNTDCLGYYPKFRKLKVIKKFPLFMGTTSKKFSTDLTADMVWVINKSNGMIQLKKLIPLEVLYGKSHNSGEIGKTWDQHHTSFSNFILKYNHQKIIEIGGLNGTLAKKTIKKKKIPWTIIDPNTTSKKKSFIKYKKVFFDNRFKLSIKDSTIVHSHTFEHLYYPLKFLEILTKKMFIDQKMIFSIPNMEVMLKKKYINTLNFEHTFFLTEKFMDYLLEKFGFKIIEKKYFKNDHSIFYSTIKKTPKIKMKLDKNYYKKNLKIFKNFIDYYSRDIMKINKIIKKSDNKIFVFGAHIFSQYLFSNGLVEGKIDSILDNDKSKQGERLYGTNLMVNSPKILKNYIKPIIILRAGVYNNEIKKDIINNINSKAQFI